MSWNGWPHDYEPKSAPEDPDVPMEVTEDQFRHSLEAATQSGIDRYSGTEDTNAVKASVSGSNILIQAGRGVANGYSWENTTEDSVTAPANASSLPRRYRAVVRYDVAARQPAPVILEGTAASNPQLPALTRSSTVWEEALASWRRNGNGGSITDFSDDRVFLNPHGPVLCRSSARPVDPIVGHSAYELDTGRLIHWDGSTWVVTADPTYPTSWSPLNLGTGFSNLSGEGHSASYQMVTPTRVRLRGAIAIDDGVIPNNKVIARAPEGARPSAYTRQPAASTLHGGQGVLLRVTVASVNAVSFLPGQIYVGIPDGYEPVWVYLDGIEYDTV